jgi:hypothetical protein
MFIMAAVFETIRKSASKHPGAVAAAAIGVLGLSCLGYRYVGGVLETARQFDERLAAAKQIDSGLCRLVILGPDTPLRFSPVVDNQAASDKSGNMVGKVDDYKVVRMPFTSSKRPNWVAYVPKDEVNSSMSREDIARNAVWAYFDQSEQGQTNPPYVSVIEDGNGKPVEPQECSTLKLDKTGHFPIGFRDNRFMLGKSPLATNVYGVGFDTDQDGIDSIGLALSGAALK